MKQFVFLAAAIAMAAPAGWGSSLCVTGSLSSYIGLASDGCMIGNDTVSMFQLQSGTAGSQEIAASAITVTPSGSTFNPTLTFSTRVSAPALKETLFTYQISGGNFVSSNITLSGTTATGDGAVTYVQNVCEGGSLTIGAGGVNCKGFPADGHAVVGNDSDTLSFASAPFLRVFDDFTVDDGGNGAASGGTFADRFTATPEPGTIGLLGLGCGLIAILKKRKIQ